MTTDPTTLAREVLDIQDRHQALNARTGLDLPIDINDMSALAIAAPALARAVLAVAELADELDQEGNAFMDDADPGRAKPAYAHAARIRAALNEDTP